MQPAVYSELTAKMAMKIGGKYTFNEIQVRHWDLFAEDAGLARAQTRKRILVLAKSLPAAARTLHSEPGCSFFGNAMIERIVDLIDTAAH